MRITIACCITTVALALAASPAAASHDISTVAGTGTAGETGDNGPASQAEISVPVAVRVVADGGYLIFAQGGGEVRRVSPFGIITTVAGNGTNTPSGDGGPATTAGMNIPSGGDMTADGGYLIADANDNKIRRVSPNGIISTAVGNGGASFSGDNGPADQATLSFPYDVAAQPDGGYLIADENNQRIRRVAPDGTISTVAGGGSPPDGLGDGGPATSAALFKPSGVTLTPDGGYLIADQYNNRIRKVSFDGTITTVAGTGAAGATGDGGPATLATLNHPARVAIEPDGGFIIADSLNNELRRVAPDGTITTVAGTGQGGFNGDGIAATSAQLNNLLGAAVTQSGDYLIADTNNERIRLVDANPPAPTLTSTSPPPPADDNAPKVIGTSAPGTTVNLFATGDCSGAPIAFGPASGFAKPGITVNVPDNSTTTFHATATDGTGNVSPCSTSSATYTEKTLPPPQRGKNVNAVLEKGKVLVKVPGSANAVPLDQLGRQIPVGSTVDATNGTVRLTSAKDAKGGKQVGHFSEGVFKIEQKKKEALTTLSLTGGGLKSCGKKLPPGGSAKVTAARRKKRKLFSSVKGRFRTRGRNSTATVRGTEWRMTDTCAGTLTEVKKGSVLVRDLTKRKTIVVKKGHSYLAKPPK